MTVPSLRDVVDPDTRGNLARFARVVGVSWTTAWRWTLPVSAPDHNVPLAKHWPAIEKATAGRWQAPSASFGGTKRRSRAQAVSIAAARKAAATRGRRRQEARP